MRAAWVYPPSIKDVPQLTQNRFFKWTKSYDLLIYPIVPASACTLLQQAGFDVKYIDAVAMRYSWDHFISELTSFDPYIVFMETKTPVINHTWRVIEKLKSILPNTKFALCGDHVSVLPMESLERCPVLDYVITGGDFDVASMKLAQSIEGGEDLPPGVWYKDKVDKIRSTGPFQLIRNLDEIPFIDRQLVPWWFYHESWRLHDRFFYIMSGRGCVYKCTFCSWPAMLYKYRCRLRSVRNVLNEIEMLVSKYSAQELFDDLDTWPIRGKWARSFCNGMIERGLSDRILWSVNARAELLDYNFARLMKKAGCRVLKIGIESANQKTLDKIKKGIRTRQIEDSVKVCKRAGLAVHLTAMIGYPWENYEDVKRTIRFIKRLKPNWAQFSIVVPYPGTELYQQALDERWFTVSPTDWDAFDMSRPVLQTGNMSPKEIVDLCAEGWKEVYFDLNFILRQIASIRSLAHLRLLFRGAKAVLQTHLAGFES